MITIARSFGLSVPPDRVWEFFQDTPAVAACLPGAELVEIQADGTHVGAVTFKLGPMTARFEGTATIDDDPTDRSARLSGRGSDRAGGSRAQIDLEYRVRPAPTGSDVEIDSSITIMGAAAQIGRPGLIEEMATRMIDDFVQCVEARLAAADGDAASAIVAPEIKGIRFFFASLLGAVRSWAKRLFGSDGGNP